MSVTLAVSLSEDLSVIGSWVIGSGNTVSTQMIVLKSLEN